MTDRELQKIKRHELLEILVKLTEENETLTAEKESLILQLQDRTLAVQEAGSIAEAALRINGVFEGVQRAADQYLENARRIDEKTQGHAEAMLMETQRECTLRKDATKRQCEIMLAETRRQCKVMLAETRRQCEALLALLPDIRKSEGDAG